MKTALKTMVLAVFLLPLNASARFTIQILNEEYHAYGDALAITYEGPVEYTYGVTQATPPAYGELVLDYDDAGYHVPGGPYSVREWSRATRYQQGATMVFHAEHESISDTEPPQGICGCTYAHLLVDFLLIGPGDELTIEAEALGYTPGLTFVSLKDLDTGEIWSIADSAEPWQVATIPVDTSHVYQLHVCAGSVEPGGSGEAWARIAVIPAPAALLLGGIGVGLVGYLCRRRLL